MKANGWVAIVGLVGWFLFGVCWWSHRPPVVIPTVAQAEAEQKIQDQGAEPARTSVLPPSDARDRKAPKEAKVVVSAGGSVKFAETEPPVVYVTKYVQRCDQEVASGTFPPEAANWTLRPGDLALPEWDFKTYMIGRKPYVQFTATVAAQTPTGVVTRELEPEERAWVSAKLLPGARWADLVVDATTIPTAEVGIAWGRSGSLGYQVSAGHDFDRKQWLLRGGVRIPVSAR